MLRVSFASVLIAGATATATAQQPSFTTYAQALPAIQAGPLPPELAGGKAEAAWPAWVRAQDTTIRQRLDRGEEDTLVNFLRFGTVFTTQPPLTNRMLLSYGSDLRVDSLAQARIADMLRAFTANSTDERVQHTREFLAQHRVHETSAPGTQSTTEWFDQHLARMRDEFLSYLKPGVNSYELFQDRGIALDTNLWPDFLIERHLANMLAEGLLKPGSVRRVAIVGPGLDFSNKEAGNDFYPPQTIQPFAVLDSLLRLGLADPDAIQIRTLDISSEVNFHLAHAHAAAKAGKPYTLQLPWNTRMPLSPEYRANFVPYWKQLGSHLGEPVPAAAVPASLQQQIETRAVRVRPAMVERIAPLDLDVVCQRFDLADEDKFDLVIGTNVFVYYNRFNQQLLRTNIAAMLRIGGYLLSNDQLPPTDPQVLRDALVTSQVVARDPEHMFTYARP